MIRPRTAGALIVRLTVNILKKIQRYFLTSSDDRSKSKSWFLVIRDICLMYQLPHPLSLLASPIPKETAKQLFRTKVTDYWQTKLRNEAADLPSLEYFKPQYMSLSRPHPLFTTCGSNSYEICKCLVQARMLSGRYRSDRLVRHFYPGSDGNCSLCPENVPGDLDHILTWCVSLREVRRLLTEKLEQSYISDTAKSIILNVINSENRKDFVQFLLDCSVHPDVISATQNCGPALLEELFRFTRSWCYAVHRTKLKLQGRWKK